MSRSAGLGGLTVSDWLEHHEPPVRPVPPAPPQPASAANGAPRSTAPRRTRWVGAWLPWVAGFALGLWFAIPAVTYQGSCPAPREGAVYCQLQHGILRAVMTLLLITAVTVLAARLPRALPRMRAVLRPAGPRILSSAAAGDRLLFAASRGQVG